VRDLPRNRERVTGVEPATLCLASTALLVITPSQPTGRSVVRGFSPSAANVRWVGMGPKQVQRRYNAGTTPPAGHTAPDHAQRPLRKDTGLVDAPGSRLKLNGPVGAKMGLTRRMRASIGS
jgi:hypothetical protein